MHLPELPSIFSSIRVLSCQFPHPHSRLLPTPTSTGDLQNSQVGLTQSPGGHCSFLLDPGVHKVLFVLSKSGVECFLQSSGSPIIKSCWASKSDSLEIPGPFQDHQTRKILVLSQEKVNTRLSTLPSGTNLFLLYIFKMRLSSHNSLGFYNSLFIYLFLISHQLIFISGS